MENVSVCLPLRFILFLVFLWISGQREEGEFVDLRLPSVLALKCLLLTEKQQAASKFVTSVQQVNCGSAMAASNSFRRAATALRKQSRQQLVALEL